jgi:poly(ribitol-phosphate) beta-N-acetylglucosaminyltransferase
MGSTVKVTVIVPTHNTAGLVTRNIDSLVGQTMLAGEYEVIYVDDGSTDGTPDVIAAAIAGRPGFKLIRTPNSGWPGRPRNIGLGVAAGEFVFFSDDDDWLERDALDRLHARAVADDADIVIGRIAGHGRGGHRAVSQASMTNGDIRSPAASVLLKSMTVHKLYRRSLIEANSLRFDEGPVRLEDHIFALRAYLRTNRVSIVHDHTAYHWVRNQGEGNHSYGSVDPEAYTRSIDRIFAIISDEIDDPATRLRFMHNWYHRKVLKHVPQAHFLDGDADYADAVVQANQRLIDKWIPLESDARLSQVMRVRAALIRLGQTDLLRSWGRYERGIRMRTNIRTCEWSGDQLAICFSVALVDAGGAPLAFARRGGRVLRDLPSPYARIRAVADTCDVTDQLARVRARLLIRNRAQGAEIYQTSTSSLIEEPLGGDRFAVRFEVEATIDPHTADHGHLITGTWDMYALLDLCGHFLVRRVSAGDNLGIALASRHLEPSGLVAKPLLTNYGNMSLRVRPAGGRSGRKPGSSPLARKLRGAVRRMRALPQRLSSATPRWVMRALPPPARAAARHVKRRARLG